MSWRDLAGTHFGQFFAMRFRVFLYCCLLLFCQLVKMQYDLYFVLSLFA